MPQDTLLLIDGNSILNRAYFAIRELTDGEGRNVNAVYGFVNILLKVINDYEPTKLVVAFDKHGHNFRKDVYPEYKANRHGMPDDLAQQMPILHKLLEAMHVAIVEKEGVEADDIIGTISTNYLGNSYVVSGDRDMFQLVSDKVTVLFTKHGVTEVELVTPELLKTNYNLTPQQVIEFKALRGDTSDNIPGVRGVGDKTATQLLEKYGDVDNVYAHIDEQKGSLADKLIQGKDMAYVSKILATIVTNADVEYDESAFNLPVFDANVKTMLEQLQFRSIISRLAFDETEQVSETHETYETEVTSDSQLQEVIAEMYKQPYFAFCYNGKQVRLCCDTHNEYVINISDNFLDGFSEENLFCQLKPLLESNVTKAVYDNKQLMHELQDMNITLNSVLYDVCIMQYLVEYRTHKDVIELVNAYGYANVGCGVYNVATILHDKLVADGMDSLYYQVELPLSQVLYEMEVEGVKIDEAQLNDMSTQLHDQLDGIAREVYSLVGCEFNISSPAQLSAVLYEKLGLKHGKKTARGYATNNDTLEKLVGEHPAIEKIMEYKKISKLLSTYLDGYKPLIKRGLVHTTYNQALTSTGRLSSSDPNLQNIPIRNELGKEIRKIFVSKHGIFIGADYSQIELRLLAAFSGDENLLGAFRNGEDIHAKVASELLDVPIELVNKDMRRTAKAVNFGIIYGISDFGLSNNAGITVKKAHEYIDLYFKRFPKIKEYLDGCIVTARNNGYVTTLTGRRRYIPELKSSNYNLRSFGERAAMNMPLQGGAADIMKIAMLKVAQAIKKEGLKSKVVMQIHDELIVDCYVEEAERVKQLVKREMENAVQLDCPLVAETEEGVTLYEA